MTKRLLLVLAIVLINFASRAQAFALVIGASDYKHLRPLVKSHHDAVGMSKVLETYGFETALLMDPAMSIDIDSSITVLLQKLNADASVGLIYFSGHAIQMNGVNYLIPTQANPQSAEDIPSSCYNLDTLFSQLAKTINRLNVVIFDASHDNPLSSEFNLSPIGLCEMNAPKNTLVASSSLPNTVTLESHVVYRRTPPAVVSKFTAPSFQSHTFTHFLIETMQKKGKPPNRLEEDYLLKIMNRTSFLVSESTNDKEVPWISEFMKEPRVKQIACQPPIYMRLPTDDLNQIPTRLATDNLSTARRQIWWATYDQSLETRPIYRLWATDNLKPIPEKVITFNQSPIQVKLGTDNLSPAKSQIYERWTTYDPSPESRPMYKQWATDNPSPAKRQIYEWWTTYDLSQESRPIYKLWAKDTLRPERHSIIGRWAKDNLNTDRFANGDPIPQARGAEEWREAYRTQKPAWSYYDNDSITNAPRGKLYNYYAMSDPRGFRKGWRLPTWDEWKALSACMEASTDTLMSNRFEMNVPGTSDFTASTTGFRGTDGSFEGSGKVACWWTKTNYSAEHVYSAQTFFVDRKISPVVVNKRVGFPIRLIRE